MVLTLIPAVTLAAAGNVENITDMSAAAIETAIHNLIPDPPAEITVEVIGTAVVDDMVWLELPGNMTVRWGADISASEPFFDWTLIFIENEDDNYAANFEVIAGGRIVNDFGIAINAEGNINVIIDGGQVISFDEDSVTIYVFDGDLLIKNGVVFGIGECWCQIIFVKDDDNESHCNICASGAEECDFCSIGDEQHCPNILEYDECGMVCICKELPYIIEDGMIIAWDKPEDNAEYDIGSSDDLKVWTSDGETENVAAWTDENGGGVSYEHEENTGVITVPDVE
ncbi:MAG: hypothetical protein FWE80_06990, partial [Oscillospiraceae bacterium]|nr:hypothetical protein [Oscillospiraceae bacterium]